MAMPTPSWIARWAREAIRKIHFYTSDYCRRRAAVPRGPAGSHRRRP
jgi:hypothetical protein